MPINRRVNPIIEFMHLPSLVEPEESNAYKIKHDCYQIEIDSTTLKP